MPKPKVKTSKDRGARKEKDAPLINIHGEKLGEIEPVLPDPTVDEPILPEGEEPEEEEDDGLELAWEE